MVFVSLIVALKVGVGIGDAWFGCQYPIGGDTSWWTSPDLGCFEVVDGTITQAGSIGGVSSLGD